MRDRQELRGEYIQKFEDDNQQELKHAISEAGLHCCDYCGYITAEDVSFKDYDFTQSSKLNQDYDTLCDNCYEYMYSQDLITPIRQD